MTCRAQLSDQQRVGLGAMGQNCRPITQQAEAGVLMELLGRVWAQAVLTSPVGQLKLQVTPDKGDLFSRARYLKGKFQKTAKGPKPSAYH